MKPDWRLNDLFIHLDWKGSLSRVTTVRLRQGSHQRGEAVERRRHRHCLLSRGPPPFWQRVAYGTTPSIGVHPLNSGPHSTCDVLWFNSFNCAEMCGRGDGNILPVDPTRRRGWRGDDDGCCGVSKKDAEGRQKEVSWSQSACGVGYAWEERGWSVRVFSSRAAAATTQHEPSATIWAAASCNRPLLLIGKRPLTLIVEQTINKHTPKMTCKPTCVHLYRCSTLDIILRVLFPRGTQVTSFCRRRRRNPMKTEVNTKMWCNAAADTPAP